MAGVALALYGAWLPAERGRAGATEQLLPAAVGQPPEVANPRKTLRQDMLHEAAQELLVGERPCAALAVNAEGPLPLEIGV